LNKANNIKEKELKLDSSDECTAPKKKVHFLGLAKKKTQVREEKRLGKQKKDKSKRTKKTVRHC
jgi:hypothetical protein